MTNTLLNLSGKIKQVRVDILGLIASEASRLGIKFFLVGAAARDLVLEHCHALEPHRGTEDLDVGVEVAGWEEFHTLCAALLSTGKFVAAKEPHRLKYGSVPVDIVPFGDISSDDATIAWPPDNAVYMNVMGFQEAYDCAFTVRLSGDPILDVKVPTIPGMALMKIISWKESYPERPKDAADLLFLMDNYAHAGNEDRLYDEETELLTEEEFDLTSAGIRLLGRDLAAVLTSSTGQAVLKTLEEETEGSGGLRLVQDMLRGARHQDRFPEILAKVQKLRQGFVERFQGDL